MNKQIYINRQTIGLLGALLPFICLAAGFFGPDNYQFWYHSMSATFYTNAVVAFVGVLIMAGGFLITYSGGYDDWRDRLVNIPAGIFAIGIAAFPNASTTLTKVGLFSLPPNISNVIHTICAAGFFILLIINNLWLFRLGNKPLQNKIYLICGLIMTAGLLLCVITTVFSLWGFLIWISEAIMLVTFGFSWLVKGKALFKTS